MPERGVVKRFVSRGKRKKFKDEAERAMKGESGSRGAAAKGFGGGAGVGAYPFVPVKLS